MQVDVSHVVARGDGVPALVPAEVVQGCPCVQHTRRWWHLVDWERDLEIMMMVCNKQGEGETRNVCGFGLDKLKISWNKVGRSDGQILSTMQTFEIAFEQSYCK